MILMLQTRTEGVTDDVFKDGDIVRALDDSYVPGTKELMRFFLVKVPDLQTSFAELESSEYTVGPMNEPILRRMRKYRVDYATKLTAEELASVKDINVSVPVMEGRFTLEDIIRK